LTEWNHCCSSSPGYCSRIERRSFYSMGCHCSAEKSVTDTYRCLNRLAIHPPDKSLNTYTTYKLQLLWKQQPSKHCTCKVNKCVNETRTKINLGANRSLVNVSLTETNATRFEWLGLRSFFSLSMCINSVPISAYAKLSIIMCTIYACNNGSSFKFATTQNGNRVCLSFE